MASKKKAGNDTSKKNTSSSVPSHVNRSKDHLYVEVSEVSEAKEGMLLEKIFQSRVYDILYSNEVGKGPVARFLVFDSNGYGFKVVSSEICFPV